METAAFSHLHSLEVAKCRASATSTCAPRASWQNRYAMQLKAWGRPIRSCSRCRGPAADLLDDVRVWVFVFVFICLWVLAHAYKIECAQAPVQAYTYTQLNAHLHKIQCKAP